MPYTDSFTDVAWSNGDYVEESKLDNMVANDRFLRDQAGMIVWNLNQTYLDRDAASGTFDMSEGYVGWASRTFSESFAATLEIAGTKEAEGASFTGGTLVEDSDKDNAITLTAGQVYTVTVGIRAAADPLNSARSWEGKIVGTQLTNYLSVWFTRTGVTESGAYRGFLNRATIIFHDEAMGW